MPAKPASSNKRLRCCAGKLQNIYPDRVCSAEADWYDMTGD